MLVRSAGYKLFKPVKEKQATSEKKTSMEIELNNIQRQPGDDPPAGAISIDDEKNHHQRSEHKRVHLGSYRGKTLVGEEHRYDRQHSERKKPAALQTRPKPAKATQRQDQSELERYDSIRSKLHGQRVTDHAGASLVMDHWVNRFCISERVFPGHCACSNDLACKSHLMPEIRIDYTVDRR
jgi:hypothetical protein